MSENFEKMDLNSPPQVELKKEEEKQKEEKKDKTLVDYLAEIEGAPDDQLVEQWKQTHGEILCSGLSETELYVFRPVTREEFVNLQAHIAQMKEQPSNFDIEVKIVETCVLWASPSGIEALTQKAGTYSTLHEQILQASNFMNAAYVAQFVQKL